MRTVMFSLIVAFAPMFIYMSCKQAATTTIDCTHVMCTQMFAMVTVEVKDASGANVTLDEAYTTRVKTGEKIQPHNGGMPSHYTVLDDSYVSRLTNQTAEFRFTGIRNGKEVVNETYTISADCCHIKKQSGRSVITVP